MVRTGVHASMLAAMVLAMAGAVLAQPPAKRPLVYGGNSGFPPYEFLDASGQPQGFGVELVRAISRTTGVPIEIRLAPWNETLRAFEAGDVDFVSLARTPGRAGRFDFLAQYWTHRYVAAFRNDRRAYPRNIDELGRETIAVQRDTVLHELLSEIPEGQRPAMVLVTDIAEAMPLLEARQVTAVASSELTVKLATTGRAMSIETVPIEVLPYYFAVREGRAVSFSAISSGLERIRLSGEYEAILERWVVDIFPPPLWKRYGPVALLGAFAVLLALAGVFVWNRQLRRQVESRTRQMDGAVQEKASLINAIDGIVWERDVAWEGGSPALNVRFISDQAASLIGYPVDRWLSESGFWEDHIVSADRTAAAQAMLDGTQSGTDFRIEYRMTHAGGNIVWIRDVVSVLCSDGRAAALRGIMIDVTAEKQAIEGLAENERRYRELVEGSPDAILILFHDEIVFVNPAAVQMLGAASAADLIGRAASALVHPDYRALVAERHSLVRLRDAAVPVVEEKILKLNGTPLDVEASAAPYREAGKLMIRVILRDIAKRKEAEQQLIHQAFHDPLTQLPNRALLFERLRHRMALSERSASKGFAVLFLDLDRFKLVNDSLGHWMGDLLLLHVRERIQSVLEPWDTLARLGGDEFTILIEEFATRFDLERLSDRIHAALSPAIDLGGNQVFVSASIGVAVGATGYEEAEEVLRDADTAMYRAKAMGRAQTVFFDEQMRHIAVASLALERDLRLAAGAGEFSLHYQPIVSLNGGRTIGIEALIRWNHPIRGLLFPSEFLACASEGGMITQLDSWALEMGCKQAQQLNWLHSGVRLSVNVSGRSLLLPDFADRVSRILDQTGLNPAHLAIEITEQVLVESSRCISEFERLRALGVELHLDDFGTGYSSLSYLTLFPISRLKIDRSFVQKLELGGRDLTVVRMVLALAEGLDLEVIAEGVENAQQADILRSMGCQSAQGHYFGRAVEAASVGALINSGDA